MASIAAVAAPQGGVFLTNQARACGYGERDIRAMLKSGPGLRLRRGAYCTCEARAADPGEEGWHRLLVQAVTLALEGSAVVSHVSAGGVGSGRPPPAPPG